jgi:hypothetical protein
VLVVVVKVVGDVFEEELVLVIVLEASVFFAGVSLADAPELNDNVGIDCWGNSYKLTFITRKFLQ